MTKIQLLFTDASTHRRLPLADGGITAGFPSPAQDYMAESIDLNTELIHNQETTFYARVCGDSMKGMGINDGDLVVIDKSLEPRSGDTVVAYIDGEFTIKQFKIDNRRKCAWLIPANPKFSPIKVTPDNDFMVWGVVTYTIHKVKNE